MLNRVVSGHNATAVSGAALPIRAYLAMVVGCWLCSIGAVTSECVTSRAKRSRPRMELDRDRRAARLETTLPEAKFHDILRLCLVRHKTQPEVPNAVPQ